MERTIIIGDIKFLDKGLAVVHSIEEVLKAGSKEELDALEDIPYAEGRAWLVVEDYIGEIVVTRQCLLNLIN